MKSLGEIVSIIMRFTKSEQELYGLICELVDLEYDRLIRAHRWRELEVTLENVSATALATVAGQNYLALPHDALHPIAMSDLTNDWSMEETSTRQHFENQPALVDTRSKVVRYSNLGPKATKRPLSINDTIQILAENPSDTAFEVRVQGLRSDVDLSDRETITTDATNGQTPVESALSYKKGWSIHGISVGEGLNGYIRIREETSTTNILAEVSEHQRSSGYIIAQLENPPDTASTIAVTYKRRPPPLVDPDDRPVIPVENALIETVIGRIRQRDRAYDQSVSHFSGAGSAVVAEMSQRRMQSSQVFQLRPSLDRRGLYRLR